MEIGNGRGEHGVVFQKRFPGIMWQAGCPKLETRNSIISWIEYEGLNKKMIQPFELDIEKVPWLIFY